MISLRCLSEADLPFGMHLQAQAGWNQTAADWRRAYELQPDGCFLAERDGAAVGTITTCVFGHVAWIALLLVDVAARGCGVGTALMRHALAHLDAQGVRSIRLDATLLGQPVYEKLGFTPLFALARYAGTMPVGGGAAGVEASRPERWDDLVRFDRSITGTDRHKLLKRLFTERPQSLRVVGQGDAVEGFLTFRPGANALQIGPCLAASAASGEALLADAQRVCAGQRVFIDVPIDNAAAVRGVANLGLSVQRPLLRMGLGDPIIESVGQLWASSGPEKG